MNQVPNGNDIQQENELEQSDLETVLQEITTLLPAFSYTYTNGKLSVNLHITNGVLFPNVNNYLAAQGILYRFPALRPLFPIVLNVTDNDLLNIRNQEAPCPYCLNAGNEITCPALKDGTCRFSKAICPWTIAKVNAKEAETYCRPHDKVSITVFSKSAEIREQSKYYGSATIETGNASKPASIEVVLCSAEIEALTQLKDLTSYDRFVHDILGSLAAAGNSFITPGMIYKTMHGDSNYKQEQITKIKESVAKMQLTWLSIDNHKERGAGYNYPKWKESGVLLPWRTVEVEYRGQKCTGYKVTEELPLFRFARARRQMSYYSAKVLLTANNLTPLESDLESYLLDQIALQPNQNLSLETLFAKFGVTANKKRFIKRKPTKVFEHCKATGVITDFKITDKQITWTKPAKPAKPVPKRPKKR